MDQSVTKRQGPLTWVTEFVRSRPILAVGLALLLAACSAVWSIGGTMILRQQRARQQVIKATEALERAQDLRRQPPP